MGKRWEGWEGWEKKRGVERDGTGEESGSVR